MEKQTGNELTSHLTSGPIPVPVRGVVSELRTLTDNSEAETIHLCWKAASTTGGCADGGNAQRS